jgi:hypothetical protein
VTSSYIQYQILIQPNCQLPIPFPFLIRTVAKSLVNCHLIAEPPTKKGFNSLLFNLQVFNSLLNHFRVKERASHICSDLMFSKKKLEVKTPFDDLKISSFVLV